MARGHPGPRPRPRRRGGAHRRPRVPRRLVECPADPEPAHPGSPWLAQTREAVSASSATRAGGRGASSSSQGPPGPRSTGRGRGASGPRAPGPRASAGRPRQDLESGFEPAPGIRAPGQAGPLLLRLRRLRRFSSPPPTEPGRAGDTRRSASSGTERYRRSRRAQQGPGPRQPGTPDLRPPGRAHPRRARRAGA